jgi:Rod binding domain-containing protein
MTILAATPGVPALPGQPAATPVDAKILKAAQDFEAMAIGQMLEPMFDTVDTAKGLLGGGSAEETFKPMLITEMAKQVEQRGGLGLANSIYAQMLKMQEKHR